MVRDVCFCLCVCLCVYKLPTEAVTVLMSPRDVGEGTVVVVVLVWLAGKLERWLWVVDIEFGDDDAVGALFELHWLLAGETLFSVAGDTDVTRACCFKYASSSRLASSCFTTHNNTSSVLEPCVDICVHSMPAMYAVD